ncbi:unnamed protein product [Prorocentrum cordatum]|uniref:AP-5 complex subunit beta-1 n=1 Tax=Prorocentrum cordatum TaxID=2364126 RepID=A0ABN9PVF0_9DINO|nr:unnamed protein product [Polarella glacialis]
MLEPVRWHGALYFALDDEMASVRAAAWHVLLSGTRRRELKYSKALEGIFQRLAALATMCLSDDDSCVREAAAEMLMDLMRTHSVALRWRVEGEKLTKDSVELPSVLQAFHSDRSLVLRLLCEARFGDGYALERAIAFLLEAGDSARGADEGLLREALRRLGRKHARALEPADASGCAGRRVGGGQCRALGHRLFLETARASQTAGASLAAAGDMDMGVAPLHLNSLRVERLRELLRAAAGERPALCSCIPGIDPGPASAGGGRAGATSVAAWAACLADCYAGVRHGSGGGGVAPPPRGCLRRLRHLRRACLRAARRSSGDEVCWEGHLRAVAAWAELLLAAAEALAHCEDGDAEVLLRHGSRVHVATSRLMHCFRWHGAPSGFPQVLLAFRLLSLRLLAPCEGFSGDLARCCSELGAGPGEAAGAARRAPAAFLPELSRAYFQGVLGPEARVEAHECHVCGAEGAGRPRALGAAAAAAEGGAEAGCREEAPEPVLPVRFSAALGGRLVVRVATSVRGGLALRLEYPCVAGGGAGPGHLQSTVAVPLPDAECGRRSGLEGSAPRRCEVRCEVPLGFPCALEEPGLALSLQPVLSVDGCAGAGGVAGGGAGLLARRGRVYEEVNVLPLGAPVRVLFTATAPARLGLGRGGAAQRAGEVNQP